MFLYNHLGVEKMTYEEYLKKYQEGQPASYQQSQGVSDAENALKQYQQNKPADYQSQHTPKIDSLYQQMQDRTAKGFQYDMNADPLYQQYKDMYTQQGKKASRDASGQVAGLTGGYGNSYAATAANQAYQDYLGKLNDRVPELQANAANQYYMQGQEMANNLSALQGMESNAFNQYQAGQDNYYRGLQAALGLYDSAYAKDYAAYQDALAQQNWRQQFGFQQSQFDYQKDQDALAQQNWLDQFNYGKEQDTLSQQNWQTQFDYARYQDALAQENWLRQFDYQTRQDILSQDNWRQQYGEQIRQFNQNQQNWQSQYDLTKAQWDYQVAQDAKSKSSKKK